MRNSDFKMNEYIYKMRISLGVSQKTMAEKLFVSPKTVSNWERKRNCISQEMIRRFVNAFDLDYNTFYEEFRRTFASLPHPEFYICSHCGNFFWSFHPSVYSCCGKTLHPLEAADSDSEHSLQIEEAPTHECYITSRHPMRYGHYIKYIIYSFDNSFYTVKLEPGRFLDIKTPLMYGGQMYMYCTKHGLFKI